MPQSDARMIRNRDDCPRRQTRSAFSLQALTCHSSHGLCCAMILLPTSFSSAQIYADFGIASKHNRRKQTRNAALYFDRPTNRRS